MTLSLFAASLLAASLFGSAAEEADALTFTADHVAVDNVTKAAVATGHVVAVRKPYSLRGDYLKKTADGTFLFADPTTATTCSNEVGHTHWNWRGELEYRTHDAVIMRNAWLRFYEIPIFWLPYLYYPLETDCGFSWMPGYTGHWGVYLLTKATYDIIGDRDHADNTWWLRGDTRFDLRYENGLAVGEDLFWNLGDFGHGKFSVYHAWDEDVEDRYGTGSDWNTQNWGSGVEKERYLLTFRHDWEPTERDRVHLRATHLSDSYFLYDFQRKTMFNLKGQWLAYSNSGAFWEHLEELFSFGVEASGRLNRFYGMTGRLPEIYLDVNPQPVFGLPVNYESESRFGYLTRDYAKYGVGETSVFGANPGVWAQYDAFRFDTYHRLTAPFRTFDDVLSVVPRVAWHGTYWSDTGLTDDTGRRRAISAGAAFRSIGEFGGTFATRGEADVSDAWRHTTEPYLDVLAQEAWFGGLRDGSRPYVFDSIDASSTWEDQFAGRSRNLPNSYYGVTPGWRNFWSKVDDHGSYRRVFDFDFYVAAQFNKAEFTSGDEKRRLSKAGDPNYGTHYGVFVPGLRFLWTPDDDATLGVRGEYDSENNRIAYASAFYSQRLTKDLTFRVNYSLRHHRYWDFGSAPYDATLPGTDELGMTHLQMIELTAVHDVCDWLAWGPHVRWDLRAGELDAVGTWIDYLTDCLGFRLLLEYDNEYTTIDGYKRESDWSIGFYIYLRAFGADSGNIFSN